MKDVRISFIAFYVIAPVLVAARVLQQFFLIDASTGFYVKELVPTATVISWSFAVFLVIMLLLAFLSPKVMLTAPKKSKPLAVASFALAAAMFFDSAFSFISAADNLFNLILSICTLAAAVCFVWYGLSLMSDIEFPSIMMLFPVIWAAVALIMQFIRYTGQSQTIDYIVSTVAMCLTLVTMLSVAKITTGEVSRKQSRIMLGIGLSAAFFCLIDTLPTYIAMIMGKKDDYIHDASVASPTLLVFAIFIPIFVHSLVKYRPSNAVIENPTVGDSELTLSDLITVDEQSDNDTDISDDQLDACLSDKQADNRLTDYQLDTAAYAPDRQLDNGTNAPDKQADNSAVEPDRQSDNISHDADE